MVGRRICFHCTVKAISIQQFRGRGGRVERPKKLCCWVLGFEAMIKYIYSGNQKIITSIQDLDLLFDLFKLADKVMQVLLIDLIILFEFMAYSQCGGSVLK